MSALAVIFFIAETVPVTGGISWAWAGFGVGMVFLFALVALGYRAGWFLPKYRLTEADPLRDPLMMKIFGPPDIAARSRRQAQVVPRYQLSGFRSEGFQVVRVAFGREFLIGSQCVYSAPKDDGNWEDQVLVARGGGLAKPMTFPELLNDMDRHLAVMTRTFNRNSKEVQASRGYYQERLRALRQRYEAHYDEYRRRRDAGESDHTLSTQLNILETKLKDLSKRLDEMK
jgi:hypothetical protein